MFTQNISIKWRITVLSGISLLLVVAAVVGFSIYRTQAIAQVVGTSSSKLFHDSAVLYLQQLGRGQSRDSSRRFEQAYLVGRELSRQVLHLRESVSRQGENLSLSRQNLASLIERTVSGNPEILGIVVAFDKNAFDGEDASFVSQSLPGVNDAGRFSWYVANTDTGSVVGKPIPESEILDTTVGLSGDPANIWYSCPRASAKTCVLNPYVYPIAGVDTLMTSIAIPLIDSGRVIGVVSLDISLKGIQDAVSRVGQSLFDGKGVVTVISSNGLVTGRGGQPEALGKPFTGTDPDTSSLVRSTIESGKTSVVEGEDTLSVITPFTPVDGASLWATVVDVPQEVLSVPARQLQAQFDLENRTSILWQILIGIAVSVVGLLLVYLSAVKITNPIALVSNLLMEFATGDGDLTKRLSYSRKDELGVLSGWFNQFLEKIHPIIAKIGSSVEVASRTAAVSAEISSRTSEGMAQQFRDVDQVATAAQEMSSSSLEVARSASSAAEAARQADRATQIGYEAIERTTGTINRLAAEVRVAMTEVEGLSESSTEIDLVLEVIRSVAEQTNLLALNAAIEAARAGDMGRGFAVVADEVRSLARRTQDSVVQIQGVIERIQQGTQSVVKSMGSSCQYAGQGVSDVSSAAVALKAIGQEMDVIAEMSVQIASAAEEQSQVSEEISRTVAGIRDVTEKLSEQAFEAEKANSALTVMANEQYELVGQFKV
ncbi:methyl-accepting chemotaxis protein [Pseudomonas fulva]|nr:methyl-accepting chemotaxis protein [Pseudomonas fulva]UQY33014.1 methyl-accepting chemotaxis protein [Pseudomonas fulva]